MGENLLALQQRLSSASIEERAKTTDSKKLAAEVQEDLKSFAASFTNNRVLLIDSCYNLLITFTRFISFDFFYILKQFDKNFTAQNPNYQPKFGRIKADILIEALKDFLEIAYPVDQGENWATLFKILKTFKNEVEVIEQSHWNRLFSLLHGVQRSSILLLIIRYVEKNPVWQSNPNFSDEHIVKPYLETIQTEAEECISSIVNAKRNSQIEELAGVLFGTFTGDRLKYYIEHNSEIYEKKNMGSFLYTRELNYLKIFLIDYYKKEIRELCDLFLIRGQWTTQSLAKPMTDAFRELMDITEKLLAFDNSLADDGEIVTRMKNYLLKAERDKGQARSLRIILNTINDDARGLSVATAKSLITLGTQLKKLYGDYEKSPHEYIINWKEIESASEIPLSQRIGAAHKKIYNFVRMLKLFIEPEEE
jgi:hypothetical protein